METSFNLKWFWTIFFHSKMDQELDIYTFLNLRLVCKSFAEQTKPTLKHFRENTHNALVIFSDKMPKGVLDFFTQIENLRYEACFLGLYFCDSLNHDNTVKKICAIEDFKYHFYSDQPEDRGIYWSEKLQNVNILETHMMMRSSGVFCLTEQDTQVMNAFLSFVQKRKKQYMEEIRKLEASGIVIPTGVVM
jgi:hypothetical protein